MNNSRLQLSNIRLCEPGNAFHNQVVDIVIEDGIFTSIQPHQPDAGPSDLPGQLVIAPGLFDLQVSGGEPGFEERETLHSLENAAKAGGVTGLLYMPVLNPVTDNKSVVQAIQQRSANLAVQIHPAGALSVKAEGKDLAELADMADAGVLAFTDDKSDLRNTLLLHLALPYTAVSSGLVMVHPEDSGLHHGGLMHEGEMNVRLGLKGTPAISEHLGVLRALTLVRYHQRPLHFNGISSAESVALVEAAKAEGLPVTCSVYAHHLLFTEDELAGFETAFKVWPPLRADADRLALIDGVQRGIIDVVCSDHRPWNVEMKDLEFGYAAFGTCGIQTLWNATLKALGDESMCIKVLSQNPRKTLGLPQVSVQEGNAAECFVYNPNASFTFTEEMNRSKAANNAFVGQHFKGQIQAVSTSKGWQAFV